MSVVNQYKGGSISKGNAVLKIRDALDSFAAEHSIEWAVKSTFTLSTEVQEILDLLENWFYDPIFIVRQIMLAANSPDFPYDQWLNIVKGLPVELEKILGAHHSLSLETKQSRDVRDLFQLVVKTPKVSRAIQTPHE
ncbi:hypothetical protein EV363DRAFT_1453641 [Boletus edulis]|nr:hypothetical protein EV363DRAFT_1453641 [Boletus edulis]